jgi:hypothetical protein
MSVTAFLAFLESSRLADAIRTSAYLFPLIESFHVVALTTVLGTIAIIDLRLLGVASIRRPFSRIASDILKWTWGAFALATATGLLLFISNAAVYYHNFFFRAKMTLLALAGLNMLIFELTAARSVHRWDQDHSAPPAGRTVAIVSLIIWISVVFCGRWIGFSTQL